jgi:hypothetical protein
MIESPSISMGYVMIAGLIRSAWGVLRAGAGRAGRAVRLSPPEAVGGPDALMPRGSKRGLGP